MHTLVFTEPGKPQASLNGVKSITKTDHGKVDVVSNSGHHTLEASWIDRIHGDES